MGLKDYLPKSRAYINSVDDAYRRGHHNYVASREVLNTDKPIDQMSDSELQAFDAMLVEFLTDLDVER